MFVHIELCVTTVVDPRFKCVAFDLLAVAAVVEVCVDEA